MAAQIADANATLNTHALLGGRGHLNSKKYSPPPSTRTTGTPMNRIAGIEKPPWFNGY